MREVIVTSSKLSLHRLLNCSISGSIHQKGNQEMNQTTKWDILELRFTTLEYWQLAPPILKVFQVPSAYNPRTSCILDTVAAWCNKRSQGIKPMKTKILHLRPKRKPCSSFCFHLGDSTLNFAYDYKYLGFWLTQFLNMEESISRSSESTNRALSLLIAKAKSNGGFSPLKFLMLATVTPIIRFSAHF